jgi:OPA family glycerol-3-phosphate transporter-like MFS transporter
MKALFDLVSWLPAVMILVYVMMDVFRENPDVSHSRGFKLRRIVNWVPMGLAYAFLYMARYNLTVSKNALGNLMTKEDFGIIFAVGTVTYALAFLLNGPLTDRIGGRRAILISAFGAAIANLAMGLVLRGILVSHWSVGLTFIFCVLYALNMYFQSFGAVAIVKVNAGWFHVRERGVFGGIFGILISLGIFFAFDWGVAIINATKTVADVKLNWVQSMLRSMTGVEGSPIDQTWWVFIVPAVILVLIGLVNLVLLKDNPKDAGFKDFYTADASAGEDDKPFTLGEILSRILKNPILLTIAFIEFCTGVLRNGVMHWYPIFLKDYMKLPSDAFMRLHWGLILMLAGVFGGMVAGVMSDKVFGSRRGPVAAVLYGLMFFATLLMIFTVKGDQTLLAIAVVAMSFCVIGTHGMLSGTSTMDFGGKRAAGTAVGLIDGFVYLGTGFQSLSLGFITTRNWSWWPIFLIPFSVIGFYLATRIWKAMPKPRGAAGH